MRSNFAARSLTAVIFLTITLTPPIFLAAYLAYLSVFGNALAPQRVTDLFNSYYSHKENFEWSRYGHGIDNYMDCVALAMMNLKSDSPPRGAIQLYVDSDIAWSPTVQGCDALREFYRGDKQISVVPFDHYWHGYTVFSKILLPHISIRTFKKVIITVLSVSFLIWNVVIIRSISGIPKMLILILSGALTLDFLDLDTSFVHKLAWLSLFLSSVVVFLASRRSLALGLIFSCIASAIITFIDMIYVTPLIPAVMVLSVFSANEEVRYRASFNDATKAFVLVISVSVLSVIVMELFRFASRSVLAGSGLGGVGTAINYFVHQEYGAKFSSSFHFGETLSALVQELFRGEFSYYGMGLLGLSLLVPSQNPKEMLPSKTSQMFCVIAALSPLLWFLFFPAASLVHSAVTGWQVFYFVWFLTVATLPGFWPANSSRFGAPKQPSRN